MVFRTWKCPPCTVTLHASILVHPIDWFSLITCRPLPGAADCADATLWETQAGLSPEQEGGQVTWEEWKVHMCLTANPRSVPGEKATGLSLVFRWG